MALILGIDTATSGCGAAMVRDGVCLAERGERMARGQSEALMPMIRDVLAEAGVAARDLDAVCVTRGPGAFTGLRIGLSAAKAFAMTLGKPCIGVGTFDAIATDAAARLDGREAAAILVAVETKRDDLYLCLADGSGTPVADGIAAPPAACAELCRNYGPVAVAGDGAARAMEALGRADVFAVEGCDVASPATVAALGARRLADPESAPATPLYLRPPDVTLPGKG